MTAAPKAEASASAAQCKSKVGFVNDNWCQGNCLATPNSKSCKETCECSGGGAAVAYIAHLEDAAATKAVAQKEAAEEKAAAEKATTSQRKQAKDEEEALRAKLFERARALRLPRLVLQ